MRAKRAKNKPARSKAAPKKTSPKVADGDAEIGRGLLAQAIEASDDELAHQVYADWLEERGHPFAQVIRLQRAGKDEDANALIGRHQKAWLEPIAKWCTDPVFERGMLRRLYGRSGEYAQKATQAALLAAATTFGVRDTMLRGPCKRLGTAETLAWTSKLWWWDCQLSDEDIATLARSPHLHRLSSLTLEKVACTNAGLEALARAELPRLHHLALPAPVWLGKFDSDGILTLLEALPITSLVLSGANTIDIQNVVASPVARHLKQFSAATRHVRAIASSRHLIAMRSLRLSSIEHVDDADVAPLLDNAALARLTSVRLTLWNPSPHIRKPSPAMVERLRARFGDGLIYESSGYPLDH